MSECFCVWRNDVTAAAVTAVATTADDDNASFEALCSENDKEEN